MSRLTRKINNTDYLPKIQKVSLSQLTDKLAKLEDIEQELGCPLEVVFEALEEGIVLENGKLYHCSLSFHKRQKYSNEDYILICYENGESVVGVSVKQYKKTWWLKGEKDKETT